MLVTAMDCGVVASEERRLIELPPLTAPGTVCARTIFTPSASNDESCATTAISLDPKGKLALNEPNVLGTDVPYPDFPAILNCVAPGIALTLAMPVAVPVVGF